MSEVKIVFLEKPKFIENDFVCLAEVFGDENLLLDVLNEFIDSEKTNLKTTEGLPDYCRKCKGAVGVDIRQAGKFLFLRHCCGVKGVITVEKLKCMLCSLSFDAEEN